MAGWVAVALLAIAGFAAFGNPGPSVQQVRLEAAAASMGHAAGAYAGLGFARLGVDQIVTVETTASPAAEPAETGAGDESAAEVAEVPELPNGWLSEVEVRALVSLHFTPADVNRAVRVAWCESRFDPASTNLRTGAVGLFQHLPQYWEERTSNAGFPGAEPTDPEASVAAAAWAIYNSGGWDTFGCQG
jgi:hypothetical protein